MIRIILSVLLLLLLSYALKQYRRSGLFSSVILLCSIVGVVLVWVPDLSTSVANHLGVGRGVDLITYLFIIISIASIFNIHLRLRASKEVVTRIVREMAIRDARQGRGSQS